MSSFLSYHTMSPIPQVDGLDTPSPITTPALSGTRIPPSAQNFPFFPTNSSIRKESFILDRRKQVKKLGRDASVNDFDIVISNSSENVNIHCSVGFYTKVAIPFFESLAASASSYIGDVAITCHDVSQRTDATGAATTAVTSYRLSRHEHRIGQVTVHLHHTTRNVQVQGKAKIIDNMKAAVWFVEYVMKDHFAEHSKSKADDIDKVNKSVGDKVSEQIRKINTKTKCAGCQAQFNGRSCPEKCLECSLYFHKSKCFQSEKHRCYTLRRSFSFDHPTSGNSSLNQTISPPQVSNVATQNSSPTYHDQSRTAEQTNKIIAVSGDSIPDLNSRQPPSPSAGPSTVPPSHPLPLPSPHAVPSSSQVLQTLNPTAAPFVTQQAPLALPTSTQHTGIAMDKHSESTGNLEKQKSKGKTKTKKVTPDVEFLAEFNKYETNILQAKVQEQETTIKDLRFKNKLLEDRVVDLEKKQKQDIYDRYFPQQNKAKDMSEKISDPEPSYSNRNMSRHCCRCLVQHSCHSLSLTPCNSTELPSNNTKDITDKFDDIKRELETMKCKIDTAINVTIPQKIRTALAYKDHSMAAQESAPSGPRPEPQLPTHPAQASDRPSSPHKSKSVPDIVTNDDLNTTIDEIMDEVSEDLNYILPTTQS